MTLNVSDRAHAAVIHVQGRFLGSIDGAEFKHLVEDLRNRGQHHVIVDLSRTDFMDSSAIGTLIAGLTTVRRDGGDMRLAGMEDRIQGLFNMTRLLGPVFENYESVDAAEASFAPSAPAGA